MAIPSTTPENVGAIRQLIHSFIKERLQSKLEALKPDESVRRQQLEEEYRADNWLSSAAQRVSQIQLASHTLKPIHPDARGTNLHVGDLTVEAVGMVGTHSLPVARDHDVVGNAAALDVFKFLSLEHDGRSLLQRAISDDANLRAALSDDADEAQSWQASFASITADKRDPASHTLAKQLYFPLQSGGYHLLAPLFPTTLVHHVYKTIREDRFGEAAKAARQARREGKEVSSGYREYPEIAIQRFGGTKPQNISQLNSERHGENWLLPSKPPSWQSLDMKPPLNVDSVFESWLGRRRPVREAVYRLREFLANTDHNNLAIRRARARMVADICDEVLQYAALLREATPGWSANPECRLHEAEKLWLDPLRAYGDDEFMQRRLMGDWQELVSKRFANWLNAATESKLVKLDQVSATQWADDLIKELRMFKEVLVDDHD